MRILLVEDDARVAAALAAALRRRGYDVIHTGTAAAALEAPAVDLVLLDLGLPDGDGIEVCRELRRRDEQVAIIVVTARTEERDRVVGLRTGADDYVVKPFSMTELQARIEAVLRRTARAGPADRVLEVGPVRVEVAARRATVNGEEVALTRKEFDILVTLAREPGAVVEHDRLALAVWQTTWVGRHTLEVHIGSLRAKLGITGLVQTVRGVGYRLDPG
ncbi:MAG: response regulator transcription factor [Micromonosporaceae bacterium]